MIRDHLMMMRRESGGMDNISTPHGIIVNYKYRLQTHCGQKHGSYSRKPALPQLRQSSNSQSPLGESPVTLLPRFVGTTHFLGALFPVLMINCPLPTSFDSSFHDHRPTIVFIVHRSLLQHANAVLVCSLSSSLHPSSCCKRYARA